MACGDQCVVPLTALVSESFDGFQSVRVSGIEREKLRACRGYLECATNPFRFRVPCDNESVAKSKSPSTEGRRQLWNQFGQ
jgi:hypothetical protein